jgi:hypothetical protein
VTAWRGEEVCRFLFNVKGGAVAVEGENGEDAFEIKGRESFRSRSSSGINSQCKDWDERGPTVDHFLLENAEASGVRFSPPRLAPTAAK